MVEFSPYEVGPPPRSTGSAAASTIPSMVRDPSRWTPTTSPTVSHKLELSPLEVGTSMILETRYSKAAAEAATRGAEISTDSAASNSAGSNSSTSTVAYEAFIASARARIPRVIWSKSHWGALRSWKPAEPR